jgi:NAD(P)-dependent dehydrogenase (short-subunit alcohol dehydrogenase family)
VDGAMSEHRVCLLTGASGRLGAAFCRLFRTQYRIVAIGNTKACDAPTQHRRPVDPFLPGNPPDPDVVFEIRSDLLEEGAVERVVEIALARHDRIDLLVNAAADTRFIGSLLDANEDRAMIDAQFRLNVMVPLALSSAIARLSWRDTREANLRERRNIVNVSSTSGSQVFAGYGQGIYSASKAALEIATRHAAEDFASIGIRVNAIVPPSFPRQVPTEKVAEAIRSLDAGEASGKLVRVS